MFKFSLVTVFVYLMTGSITSQQYLSVEEAIELGLKNNYSIRIAENNAEIAENNTGRGTANFLPQLDASGNYTLSKTDQESNSPFSFGDSDTKNFGGQISLNWTLFDGFRMFADNIRYNELAKLGELAARNIIENTVVNILRAYFNLVQQEQLLKVALENLEISGTRFEKQKIRNDLGSVSSTDLLNAEVSFNNDKSILLEQELRTEIAMKDLNLLLALDPSTKLIVEKEIELPPLLPEKDELVEQAKEMNSSLLIANQNRSIAEQNVDINESVFYPRLLLNGSYGYSDRTVSSQSPQFSRDINTTSYDGTLGLNLQINIFNGFRDKISLQNSKIEKLNQEIIVEETEAEVEGLVTEKYLTLKQRFSLIEIEQQNAVAAEQNLLLQQERFETGTVNSLEFRDAQLNLLRVKNALITARYQARITFLELQQLTGSIIIK